MGRDDSLLAQHVTFKEFLKWCVIAMAVTVVLSAAVWGAIEPARFHAISAIVGIAICMAMMPRAHWLRAFAVAACFAGAGLILINARLALERFQFPLTQWSVGALYLGVGLILRRRILREDGAPRKSSID